MNLLRLRFAVALSAMVAAAGCSPLAPRPDLTKFYLLTPASNPGAQNPSSSVGRTIGLGPVHFPDYLSRDQVVTRLSPNQVEISDTNRWAEPLNINFTQVLSTDLAEQLPSDRVVTFPWNLPAALDYQLRIEVTRFEADHDGSADLSAHWTLIDSRHGRQLFADESHLKDTINPGESAGGAAALSRLLNELSRQIAQRIRQAESG